MRSHINRTRAAQALITMRRTGRYTLGRGASSGQTRWYTQATSHGLVQVAVCNRIPTLYTIVNQLVSL